MDVEEVKACLRALLSSSAISYNLNSLLNDFKQTTGIDMPLFGWLNPIQFLSTLDDTVLLFGNYCNPEIALVESQKSAHITSLVDRQRTAISMKKYAASKPKRLIIPDMSRTHGKDSQCVQSKSSLNSDQSESSETLTKFSSSSLNVNVDKFTPKSPSTVLTNLELSCTTDMVDDLGVPGKDTSIQSSSNKSSATESNSHSPEKSPNATKTTEPFSENVSDSESCFSIEDSGRRPGYALSTSCCSVNDGIKCKLMKIIKQHQRGLWCCELPELFQKEYKFELDFREYGYTSLIQMLSELPDVFRCIRPGNEDWILFDASVAPSAEEKEMTALQAETNISSEVTANMKKLLNSSFKNPSGIELDRLLILYKKMFDSPLDFESLGFKDFKSLLKTWEGSFLSLLEIDGNTYVVPPLKGTVHSPVHWQEAVPPITAEDDIFVDIFPKDVVGPEESLLEIDLTRHIAVGHKVRVSVAEVWSPGKFYLQFNKYKNRLGRFMDDMQKFYNVHLNKYKMPDSTIRPKQICVGLYTSDTDVPDEWHRAKVVKVINDKVVLVNLIDFGTIARIRKTQLRFLHRSFQSFPVQGFLAKLAGVAPVDNKAKWPMSTSKKFLEYVQVPYLDAEMIDIDFKVPSFTVVLCNPSQNTVSINQTLVLEKLACKKQPEYDELFGVPETSLEKQTKILGDGASGVSVQEKVKKNLPEKTDAFSDIADLSEATMFPFKMKSLKTEDSPPSGSNEPGKNLKYEFEEVLDLEVTQNRAEKIKEEGVKYEKLVQESGKKSSESPQPGADKPENFSQGKSPLLTTPPIELQHLPPGLEQMNLLPNFHQSQMQPGDIRQRVNLLVTDFLLTKPTIQQVALADPVLALKIAVEMAEASVAAELSRAFAFPSPPVIDGVSSYFLKLQGRNASDFHFRTAQQKKVTPNSEATVTDQVRTQEENEYVKEIQIGGRILHLVTIDTQMYFCADELVEKFTLFSSREIAENVLRIKKFITDYRVIKKETDAKVLRGIKSSQLPAVKKKSTKKLKIYLIPLSRSVPFLQALGCHTKTFEKEFQELQLTGIK